MSGFTAGYCVNRFMDPSSFQFKIPESLAKKKATPQQEQAQPSKPPDGFFSALKSEEPKTTGPMFGAASIFGKGSTDPPRFGAFSSFSSASGDQKPQISSQDARPSFSFKKLVEPKAGGLDAEAMANNPFRNIKKNDVKPSVSPFDRSRFKLVRPNPASSTTTQPAPQEQKIPDESEYYNVPMIPKRRKSFRSRPSKDDTGKLGDGAPTRPPRLLRKNREAKPPKILETASRDTADILRQLSALQNRHCPADYDKYMVLDERDKILCKLRERDAGLISQLSRCSEMCSEKERFMRIVQKRASPYECDYEGNVNPAMMIKEYARSAADQERPLPHELRTEAMMQYTMSYLLKNVLDAFPSEEQRTSWYDFLWSRTRAVRKEVTQLSLTDATAVTLVERCTRLHILCGYILCTLEVEQFDPKMNNENLGKCLQTLRHMYEDFGRRGIHMENEAEFRAYDVMLHLEDTNVLSQVLAYRSEVRDAKPVRLALQLAACMHNNNFCRFFRLLKNEATFLQCCVSHKFFEKVRRQAVSVMSKAYGRNSYPIERIRSLLAWDTDQAAIEALKVFGISPDPDSGEIYLNRDYLTDNLPPHTLYTWIDQKRTSNFSQVVYGSEPFKFQTLDLVVSNSFDAQGRYNNDRVLNEIFARSPVNRLLSHRMDHQRFLQWPRRTSHRDLGEVFLAACQLYRPPPRCPRFLFSLELKNRLIHRPSSVRPFRKPSIMWLSRLTDRVVDQCVLTVIRKEWMKKAIQDNQERELREQREAEQRRIEKEQRIRLQNERIAQKMTESLLEKTVVDRARSIVKKQFEIEKQRRQVQIATDVTEKLWQTVAMKVINKRISTICEEIVRQKRREDHQRVRVLEHVRGKMHQTWLRQFWDQWRSFASNKKLKRTLRENGLRSCMPMWDSPAGEEMSRRYMSASLLPLAPRRDWRVIRISRKRRHRIISQAFEKWRQAAKKKASARKWARFAVADDAYLRRYITEPVAAPRFRFAEPCVVEIPVRKRRASNSLLFSPTDFSSTKQRRRSQLVDTTGFEPFSGVLKSSISETDMILARNEMERIGWTIDQNPMPRLRRAKNVVDLTNTSLLDEEETRVMRKECSERMKVREDLLMETENLSEELARFQAQMQRSIEEFKARKA
ncbi:unnamed protein product [Caenorhabditis auriculariae]|uniref:SAC3/GANP/THP3 conserved domain-containing protein n=1 Tax=Caenorhabditis auriculariae TaxID=2777116 RepID=A0A8S1HFL5_9PELO|nr:unnamed protein product [Caenorhabditis auriculariae]